MGQIQNAVASIVGSSAIGAIGKTGALASTKKELASKTDALASTKKELASVKEDLELTYETLESGVNPLTGFDLGNTHDAGKADASNANMVMQTANKQVQQENVSARKQQLQTKGGV
jgi:hypothetical protein